MKFNYENQIFQGKASLNVQYKTLNLYDQNSVRVNTNKEVLPKEWENIENQQSGMNRKR